MSRRYEHVSPTQALSEAASLLSRTNPRNLWSLCAMLSAVEALPKTTDQLLFFPALNLEKVRLLCEAVIDSRALDYKTQDLTVGQLVEAINYCNQALADPETLHAMEELRTAGGPDLALHFFMARLGNVQIRYQDARFHERVGRFVGMFESLPRSHRHKMPAEFWAMADPVLETAQRFLEFQILKLAVCAHVLLEQYEKPFTEVLTRYSALPRVNADHCFRALLHERHRFQRHFLVRVDQGADRTVLRRFLELFARTTRELRELRRADIAYRRGAISRRLSPLERYPVVWINTSEVVVPNARYLYRNFADIIHFSLWEQQIPNYNQVRGGLQELYLHALIERQLPAITVIPERPYRRGKDSVRSSDLTLIEDDRLILLESKAQRIRAETRLEMTPDNLLDNLKGARDAIDKSERKIGDLYDRLPEFGDVQEIIDRTRNRPPIRVAVIGEEIAMMGELLRELAKSYRASELQGARGSYCILGIDALERAVEVASSSESKLGDLLEAYIAEATIVRPDTPPADEFGGRIDVGNTFAISFIEEQDEQTAATRPPTDSTSK